MQKRSPIVWWQALLVVGLLVLILVDNLSLSEADRTALAELQKQRGLGRTLFSFVTKLWLPVLGIVSWIGLFLLKKWGRIFSMIFDWGLFAFHVGTTSVMFVPMSQEVGSAYTTITELLHEAPVFLPSIILVGLMGAVLGWSLRKPIAGEQA